jgi:hypothetical protein
LLAHAQSIPLEKACRNGGLPDTATLKIAAVDAPTTDGGTIAARFSVVFEERYAAGCSTTPATNTILADFTIQIPPADDPDAHRIRITYLPGSHEPEF